MADAPVIVTHERLADFIASVLEAMKIPVAPVLVQQRNEIAARLGVAPLS